MEANKPVATIIIFLVTCMLVLLFVVPKFNQSQALNRSLAQKQGELNGKSAYYTAISETLTSLQTRSEAFGKVKSSLPGEDSLAPLLAFFQQQGQASGVSVTSVAFAQDEVLAIAKLAPKADQKEIKNVTLMVELTGNYQGLKNFLKSLENSSRLIEVVSISLNPVQSLQVTTQRQKNYHVTLEIVTHTY